ncbi:MAG TPA: WD40 repeat domain-containing protein [Gemmataceae bacterium]|nr:WD40 repeat domain-containing protein [Gemmataceae bacterium]
MRTLFIALLLPPLAAAETGPAPREVRLDLDGDILPPGAIARLGSTRYRELSATRIALTPDGTQAICSDDDNVRVWDLKTGKTAHVWRLPNDFRGVVSADGQVAIQIFLGIRGAGADVWDVPRGKKVRSLGDLKAGNRFAAVALAPDGRSVVTVDARPRENLVRVWDLASGTDRVIGSIKFEPDYLYFLDGGRKVLAWDARGTVAFAFDLADGIECYRVELTGQPFLRPSGNRFLLHTPPAGVAMYDAATGKLVAAAKLPAGLKECQPAGVSPDGRCALLWLGGEMGVWDFTTGKLRFRVPLRAGPAAFRDDGKTLAVASDGALSVLDAETGKDLLPPADPRRLAGPPMVFAWARDGKTVGVTGSGNGPGFVFDSQTGELLRRPVHERLIAGWFLLPGLQSHPLPWRSNKRDDDPVHAGAKALLRGPDGGLPGFRITTGGDERMLAIAGGDHEPARIEDVSKIYWTLESRTYYRDVSVRERYTGRRLCELSIARVGDVGFSQDNRLVATLEPAQFRVWDIIAGQELLCRRVVRPDRPPPDLAFGDGLAFSPDGRQVAIGNRDGTILIWDVAIPRPKPAPLSPADLLRLWDDLRADDPKVGWKAVHALSDRPADALHFLMERMKHVTAPDATAAKTLLEELDSPTYRVREAAMKKVLDLGDAAKPFVEESIKTANGAELRKRLETLLPKMTYANPPTGDDLRRLRAIAVLEAAGTKEARGKMDELARGLAAARVTVEAKVTLDRLGARDQAGR